MNRSRLRIGPRIFIGFFLIAFLTLMVATVSIAYLRGVGEDLLGVAERDRVLQTKALELRLAVEQESDSVRGYLLSGDKSFLDASSQATVRYSATAAELRALAVSDPTARSLEEINALHSKFLSVAKEQTNLRDQGFPSAAIFLWQTQGNEVKSSLDGRLSDLVTQREVEIAGHTAQARNVQNRARLIALGLVGLTWAVGIAAGIVITRSITRPIRRLVSATESMRKGDLSVRVPQSGGDELGLLGAALNNMAGDLDRSTKTTQRLYHQELRRVEQMRTINDIGRQISSILSLDQLLPYVSTALQKTFQYYNVNIFILDNDSTSLVLKAGAGGYEGAVPLGIKVHLGPKGIVSWVAQAGRPLLVPDVCQEPRYLAIGELKETKSELAVPVKIQERVVGVLDVQSNQTNGFDEADQFIAETLSSQLAVAIENARLYEQGRELAAVQERQRLARDLHDAVTQTLFSAALIADVLPRLGKKNPTESERRVEELRQLTRGALAEMRMLLLELRPSALTEVGLGELLRHLTDAITGRARLAIDLRVEGECDLPPDAQVALYRIAQESLNNIVKHSGASAVSVHLASKPGSTDLTISDNGLGFDPTSIPADHLGLRIMRERAEAAAASLSIESSIGHGTTIEVLWPRGERKESLWTTPSASPSSTTMQS